MRNATRRLGLVVAVIGLVAGVAGQARAGIFLTMVSENTTGIYADSAFTGAPDEVYGSIGGQVVTYDVGAQGFLIRDGAGVDFSVYEVGFGVVEFAAIDVLVSLDGLSFTSVKASETTLVHIAGDQRLRSDDYGRSYDLGLSGLESARYIRIDGVGDLAAGSGPTGTAGFELDAVGAINVAAVPEPSTLISAATAGLMGLGYGLRRRRKAQLAA